MNLFFRFTTALALLFLVSCVESKAGTEQSHSIKEKVVSLEIARCHVGEVLVSLKEVPKEYFYLEIDAKNTSQTVRLDVDTLDEPPTIKLQCTNNGFDILYVYEMGNSTQTYIHSFAEDKDSEFQLNACFFETSDRNGISLSGKLPDEKIPFVDYSFRALTYDTDIYSFSGYQDGEEPSITTFFEKVKASKDNHRYLALLSHPNVILFLLDNLTIDDNTISEFNDIAYYFEQAGYYQGAISILNEVISVDPNRTVAYINLGDAHWGLQQFEQAKTDYSKYVSLMKEKGIEGKIPERVHARMSN